MVKIVTEDLRGESKKAIKQKNFALYSYILQQKLLHGPFWKIKSGKKITYLANKITETAENRFTCCINCIWERKRKVVAYKREDNS